MKKFIKCKITIILLAGWAVLSLVGYLGRNTIYNRYCINSWKMPYFVLVVEGMHDGVFPWSKNTGFFREEITKGNKEGGEGLIGMVREELQDMMEEAANKTAEASVVLKTIEKKEFVTVDKDYFSDAVFIGDSRTVGLYEYGRLDGATFYATVGMNIYDLWTEEFCEVDGKKVTLEEALSAQKFGKVYFQIGINEMGRGTVDGFMKEYADSVEKFRQLQPDAVIFVQGIMRVTKKKSDSDPIFNNAGISERNERIAELEDNINIFYIDLNEAVCDEEGNLDQSLTFDDIHLYASKYGAWVEFLMTHGIT